MSVCESEAYETVDYENDELPPVKLYPGWVRLLVWVGGSVGSWLAIYYLGKALGFY